MVKKTKKTISVYEKMNQFILRNKRESIIAGIFLLVIVVLLGLGAYAQYSARADINNVIKMREGVKELISRTSDVDKNIAWRDQSTCSTYRPRSFGEDMSYSCNAYYIHARRIESQKDIDQVVGDITSVLRDSDDMVRDVVDRSSGNIVLSGDPTENTYYNATGFVFNGVNLGGKLCYVRYVLTTSKDQMEAIVECTVSTKKAYFEPIIHR